VNNFIEPLEDRRLFAVPAFDPTNFGVTVTNPYMPLIPGTTYIYKGVQDGEPSRIVTQVTRKTKDILGVTTTVVRDRAFVRGELIEATLDWYAQDVEGNVWYFGEDTKELEDGKVVSTEGSWQAGVNGARPGIIMEAHPKVGDFYRQEFAGKVAADMARVLSVNTSTETPFASFGRRVLQTQEFTRLEPGVIEHKFYARGIGFVRSVMVRGGTEVFDLVGIRYG